MSDDWENDEDVRISRRMEEIDRELAALMAERDELERRLIAYREAEHDANLRAVGYAEAYGRDRAAAD